MKAFGFICAFLILCCVVIPVLMLAGRGCSMASDGLDVAQQELTPSALLKKYTWFKDAAAALDARHADIGVYETRAADAATTYGADASKWPRDVRESAAQARSELAGLKASYNTLAADYNAQMAKANWRFCNAGDLPAGADVPLPRSFRAYESK